MINFNSHVSYLLILYTNIIYIKCLIKIEGYFFKKIKIYNNHKKTIQTNNFNF